MPEEREPKLCLFFCKHFLILSSLMKYFRVCSQIITVNDSSFAVITYPYGAHEFILDSQWGSCYSIFSFMCRFCRLLFFLLSFSFMLSVHLRFRDSDYPFGIFKLFSYDLSTVNLNTLKQIAQSQNITNPNYVKVCFFGSKKTKGPASTNFQNRQFLIFPLYIYISTMFMNIIDRKNHFTFSRMFFE